MNMENIEHMFNIMRASDAGMFPYDLTEALVESIYRGGNSVHRASAIEWITKVWSYELFTWYYARVL